jgi:DNA-binding SARP family transcriptional activator/Tfp pilus assembly protein PilF
MRGTAVQRPTYIKLLGAFTLRVGDGDPVALPTKAQALVALLALHGDRPVKREIISEWLWPDRADRQARNSLKQELYVLRRDGFAGRGNPAARDNALTLLSEQATCDVQELRALLHAGTGLSWQAIAALYAGPLLQGFPPISPEFDDFVSGMRRMLEADVVTALGRLADAVADGGDAEQCVAIAERMLEIDPLREDTHRLLIQSYARLGRRADAMRVYSEARALLQRELDVTPAAETETLIARIREGRSAGAITLPARALQSMTPAPGGPPRIAVLPLRQYLDKPLPSHISDGLTADIISQLAGLRELTVISHGSTFALRDPAMDPSEIGRKLNARYLVVCNLRPAGDSLRLTTELTEAETTAVVSPFNDYVDAALSFEDQDRIVGRVVNQLVPQVRESEIRRIRGQRPSALGVYEKILLSREHITALDQDHFPDAKTLLEEVMQEDPGYGEAYALAAEWHSARIGERWSADRAGEVAAVERLIRTALRVDSNNIRALLSHGHRRSMSYRDPTGAMRIFRQALSVAPSSAYAWALSGLCVAYAGDGAEAVRQATRALEISPCDREAYKFYHALCVAHYTMGNYEQAADWGLRAMAGESLWRGTRGFTAASLAALGRLHEAREITAQMRSLAPGRRIGAVLHDLPYQDAGQLRRYGEHLVAAGYPE